MTTHRSLARRAAALSAAVAAALVLAACGSDDDGAGGHGGHDKPSAGAPAGAPDGKGAHNAADVAFAQGMIPHHRQAVEMADLAATRASSAQVKKLAAEIKQAQDPEIRTMSGWLKSWGEEVPAADSGADHSAHHGMPGMMTAADMEKLERASGAAFDTAFLELMVKHHQGAVEMAGTEKSKGAHQGAKALAGRIITTQNAEITRMDTLLGKD
ncbi:DUF305 domain-containing protein [Streptomyces sp. NPDC018031]|uniref:DUF305 domain-containing protein n=1 Tax=Streptomyces sp. NPDC018031 TaxID=3365033 RepID=UPI0037B0FAFB